MKTLVAYYSWSGNTKRLAKQIAKELHADLFDIGDPDGTFHAGMYETADIDDQMKRMGQIPRINSLPDINQYDQILVGGPVWTYQVAGPVVAFLHQIQAYQGRVCPFYTSVGNSAPYEGHFRHFAEALKVGPGFDAAHDNFGQWIQKVK